MHQLLGLMPNESRLAWVVSDSRDILATELFGRVVSEFTFIGAGRIWRNIVTMPESEIQQWAISAAQKAYAHLSDGLFRDEAYDALLEPPIQLREKVNAILVQRTFEYSALGGAVR